jgi:protein involved in polysaccharide export with SLBB domain
MAYPKLLGLRLLLLLALTVFVSGLHAQELEDIVQESEAEDEEVRELSGVEIEGTGEEPLGGRLRFPKGEEVSEIRFAQDRQIDPKTYLIGPGDILQLYIWGDWDLSYPLQVDPEGNVLVPSVGVFKIADQTLADVKDRLKLAALEKYPGVEVTLTLASMRFFTVYLTGPVIREGGFTINPATRLFDLIEQSGGYLDELRGSVFQEIDGQKSTRIRKFKSYPTGHRSIQLTHSDGTIEIIDQEMYLATGDQKYNPYLRMGDRVKVGFAHERVYVYGAVNRAGSHEFRPGDTIETYLTLAAGLRYNSDLNVSELWRFQEDGIEVDQLSFRQLTGKDPDANITVEDIKDIPLEPEDMIFFRTRSHWKAAHTVSIRGEVEYTGQYRIVPGETTLRDVIEQAGGFTERASMIQSKLFRTKLRALPDAEYKRLVALQRVGGRSELSPEDKAYLKTKRREERGRYVVDFVRLFEHNDESQNVLLEGNDVISIPEKRHIVKMTGQFIKPGLVDYFPGDTVENYIEQAGGFTWRADISQARLIRAKTGIRLELGKKEIATLVVGEGDVIWVPEKPYFDFWKFTRNTVRFVAEATAIVVLATSYGK